MLPFGLGRKPRIGPTCIGIRLKEADVTDRSIEIERLQSMQREFIPSAAMILAPVEWCMPRACVHAIPAFGEPQFMSRVAAIGDERKIVAIGHKPIGDLIWVQEHLMTGRLVIERKVLARVSNFDKTTGEG